MKGLLCFQSYVAKKAVLYLFYVGCVCVCVERSHLPDIVGARYRQHEVIL